MTSASKRARAPIAQDELDRTRRFYTSPTNTVQPALVVVVVANMAALIKIAPNSPSKQNPSELETAIAGALYDLESNTQDLKAALRPLQIVSAREVSRERNKCIRTAD